MIKKIKERKSHFLILAFLCGLFLGMNFSFIASANEPVYRYLDYFHRVYQLIKTDYVDVPDNKKMFYGAIQGMIKSLGDPFTRFLDNKSYSALMEMTTGKFVGVGIVITIRDGEVIVISPIDGSPAMDAGIISGDIIKKVNTTFIKNKKLSEIVKMIKGLPKTNVKLYVRRAGYDELIEFEIERKSIKIQSVKFGIIKEKNVGYIKIKNFGSDTTKDTTKAIKFFNSKGIDKLIVDLRYNPGGLLQASVNISDLFLKKGEIIVSTRGRKGTGRERIFKSVNDPLYKGKLILLVNNGSASASEILSGAIRDNKRGKLLGIKTFGKGSVQKTFNLDKNIGIALTIAKYYTPSGEMIHKKGINPDYKVESEKISAADLKSLKSINKKRLIDKFVEKHKVYNDETKTNFSGYLKNNGFKLSERTKNFVLKRRINRFKKQAVYDLEFDSQLVSSLKKINE